MNIGDVIASSRRRKRIDQKQMASELNISPSYLSQIESKGRMPSAKLLSQIAEKLDIPVSALLFEAVNESDYSNPEDRQLFLQAKPLIDKMFSLLLADDTQKQE